MEQLSGLVDELLFSTEGGDYAVGRLKVQKGRESVVIVGKIGGIHPGEAICCRGFWKSHPKYGLQFHVDAYEIAMPADLYGIRKYLGSGLIKGIGPIYARRIVDSFGEKTLDVIDKNPQRLIEIAGIGKKRRESIIACWEEQRAIRQVMIFLQTHGLAPSLAQKIYKVYGAASIEKIEENPYALARDIFRIGFATADKLAQSLGISATSPQRVEAGIAHFLWEASGEGHVCYPAGRLLPEVGEMLQVRTESVLEGVDALVRKAHLIRRQLPHGEEVADFLWVCPLYLAEVGIAREIARLREARSCMRPVAVDKAITWVERALFMRFSKGQREAIALCLQENIHIITGGPGTGKSSIIRAVVRILSKITKRCTLTAPTGRAAKRMTELSGCKASTIHSLLEFDFKAGKFKRNRDQPLAADLVIVDETSMVDTQLMHHLLQAIPDGARLILLGDIDQLPSVGPGNVLKDLIDSKILAMTRLKWIFRQGKGSLIVKNAHRINAGFFPIIDDRQESDFFFWELESPEEIAEKILELITREIPSRLSLNPVDDIQVLSPMKRGAIGVDYLNALLQRELNPQSHRIIWMGRSFHLYDKIMQVRNNYDKQVYNGDVGRIVAIEGAEVTVDFEGKEVVYSLSELDELTLAYAVSVHKYQGSECPCIIFPIHLSHFKLLFRNLLYTGITRGKKCVVLIGSRRALAIAIQTNHVNQRFAGLSTFLGKEEEGSLC